MKSKIALHVLRLVMITAVLSIAANCANKKAPQGKENPENMILNVDEVIASPGSYKGIITIKGKVLKAIRTKNIILLGCEDACRFLPVKYSGKPPQVDGEITVRGEIKKTDDGRFVFVENQGK